MSRRLEGSYVGVCDFGWKYFEEDNMWIKKLNKASSLDLVSLFNSHISYILLKHVFSPWRDSPPWAKASSLSKIRDHIQTHPHSVGLLWTSDQPDAETST
jgi:hypothetical protein